MCEGNPGVRSWWLRVSGFRVQGLGFRVQGFRILEFGVQVSELRGKKPVMNRSMTSLVH